MEYPKIHSLFKRNEDHSFIMGQYSCAEFGAIKHWRLEEKIDGTNIRIIYDPTALPDAQITFLGRSKDSAMPAHLLQFLKNYFTLERLQAAFPDLKAKATLFGEGYGNNIQAAGPLYRPDVNFMLFDILIGHWWLTREAIHDKAQALGLPIPPDLGIMTEEQMLAFVLSKPMSKCSIKPLVLEGIIARTEPLMLFRDGKPVMTKLKVKDFK